MMIFRRRPFSNFHENSWRNINETARYAENLPHVRNETVLNYFFQRGLIADERVKASWFVRKEKTDTVRFQIDYSTFFPAPLLSCHDNHKLSSIFYFRRSNE